MRRRTYVFQFDLEVNAIAKKIGMIAADGGIPLIAEQGDNFVKSYVQ